MVSGASRTQTTVVSPSKLTNLTKLLNVKDIKMDISRRKLKVAAYK